MPRQNTLTISLGSKIRLQSKSIPPVLKKRIYEKLVFVNPDFQRRHRNGEMLGNVNSHIKCLRENHQHIFIPRGFLYQLTVLCRRLGVRYRILDSRPKFETIRMEFHGQLKDYQKIALEEILRKDFGILVGGPKTGKKVIALKYVSSRSVPTLIIAPHANVVKDWERKVRIFLQIDSKDMGIIEDRKYSIGNKITLAHTSGVTKKIKAIRNKFGLVVIDDCNYCPARFFSNVVSQFNSLYTLGLAGSTTRKDGLSRLMYYYVGDIIHTIDRERVLEDRSLVKADIKVRETPFHFPYSSQRDFPALMESLMQDQERLKLIASDVKREFDNGSTPILVLSGGSLQSQNLSEILLTIGIKFRTVDVKASHEELKSVEAEFNKGHIPLLLAPLNVISKSFMPTSVSVLFLITPVYFKGELAEFLKSLNSGNPRSRVKIYDYVDTQVGILKNYFRIRSYSYGMKAQPVFLENS
ncbi:MAG TPA: hypothetical protein ENG51_19130, partial [Deltaproteobacteria bacterium]|nr:hypothetical protein [Deltaproteobacteria bacterium]